VGTLRTRTAAGTGAAAVLAALLLASCAGGDARPAPSFLVHSAPPALPAVAATISPGLAVASGDLEGIDARASGHVEISVETPARYLVRLTDLSTDAPVPAAGPTAAPTEAATAPGAAPTSPAARGPWTEVMLCPGAFDSVASLPPDCGALAVPVGALPTEDGDVELELRGVDAAPIGGDPSFLRSLVFVQREPGAELGTVIAAAPLTWRHPDVRPGLVVADAGPRAGAAGPAEVVDGVPVSYAVAPGDSFAAIAARFGIDEETLLWLNPVRTFGPDSGANAYADEVLNLSPDGR